jgi:DNA segregation ATPase FtsK/SpoIIIE, S-DNA-T family
MPNFSLLRDNRIGKSIRGLKQRLEKCVGQIADIQANTGGIKDQMLLEFDDQVKSLKQQYSQSLGDSLTRSDEAINGSWTKFDRQTLSSLHGEQTAIAKRQEEYNVDSKNLATKLAQRLESLKVDATNERTRMQQAFEANKESLRRLRSDNESIFSDTQNMNSRMVTRWVQKKANETPYSGQVGDGTFAALKSAIDQDIAENRKRIARVVNHPLARFTGSWQLWATSLILGIIASVVVWQTQIQLEPVARLLAGLGAFAIGSVGFGIIAMAIAWPILGRASRRTVPHLLENYGRSRSMLAAAETHLQRGLTNRVTQIESKLKSDTAQSEAESQSAADKLKADFERDKIRFAQEQAELRKSLHANFETKLSKLHVESTDAIAQLKKANQTMLANAQSNLNESLLRQKAYEDARTAFIRGRIRSGIARTASSIESLHRSLDEISPNWPDDPIQVRKSNRGLNDPGYIPIGQLQLTVGQQHEPTIIDSNTQPLQAHLPVVFKLIEHGFLMIRCNAKNHQLAQKLVRDVLLRAFYSLPAGELQATIIDPDGLGREYSHLMQLADSDPTMVNHRVWTQGVHITEQLAKLSHHTEDVIQQLLRDRYQDIRQYNRDAGSMSEPFRIVVWSRFPAGVDEASWRYLSSLVSSGGRCGVSTILIVDEDFALPPSVDLHRFENIGLTIQLHEDSTGRTIAKIVDATLSDYPLDLIESPSPQVQSEVLKRVAEDALRANRVEVPFDAMISREVHRYQSQSNVGLTIPIGQAGVGRIQSLRLGHGTAQHVLVAGKTGSGKSSFLHTLVTSAAVHYSPHELRLVLLDFKKGVEFQVYSETHLSHADIIGIESQREFGLSALEYLDRVMQKRGEAFRSAGVQDIPSWCSLRPHEPMPRILVVVDEFQEIFTEDDKLAQQASMFLDRIVRQGRSFGIHVVLASQTLGGAYSLPRTTLAQMAVRVALQCEGADAMMILSEDNLAAERLRHSGQAVYNDQSGRIEGNQPFQVSFLTKPDQREILAELQPMPRLLEPMHGGLEKCIIFDGHRKAAWNDDAMVKAIEQQSLTTAPTVLLGDSVSIEPIVAVTLQQQAGQNILLVGNDDENMAAVLRSIASSYRMNTANDRKRRLTYVDAAREEDQSAAGLYARFINATGDRLNLHDSRRLGANNVDDAIADLHAEMQRRIKLIDDESASANDIKSWTHEFVIVTHLGRLRSLRKNDEFSFGNDDKSKTDKFFADLLRDGPAVGISMLVCADSANTVGRWLNRQSMHDLEYRVMMQMSVNDSNHLIDSAAANRLDKHVMLLYAESTGLIKKFRPFAL